MTILLALAVAAVAVASSFMAVRFRGNVRQNGTLLEQAKEQIAAQCTEQEDERRRVEEAAPEGRLEAAGAMKPARNDTGRAPHERRNDHREDGAAVRQAAAEQFSSRRRRFREPGCRTW